MYVGERYIYFELQKAASSYVREVLGSLSSLNYQKVGIHNSYYEASPRKIGDLNAKIKIGSVRNPWDWYVSLWTWGCTGHGIYNNLMMPRNRLGLKYFALNPIVFLTQRKSWRRVYSDSTDINNFRTWLKMLLCDKNYEVGDGYTSSVISNFSGYLTYCYLKLHCYDFRSHDTYINSYNDIVSFDRDFNFLDFIVTAENLNNDLEKALLALNVSKVDIENVFMLIKGRANSTERQDYHVYYDNETLELIAEKEKFIIEKYNYKY
jgi:hypothetical protein